MPESFYATLGVAPDADAGVIREAYRRRVKERHPDVSDDPGAPREFRRLTTARDVLTDEAERERYDRLGHATYVERHLETNAWTTGDGSPRDGESGDSATEATRGASGTGRGRDDRSAWLGDDWDGPRQRRGRRRRRSTDGTTDGPGRAKRSASAAGAGAARTASWQQASAAEWDATISEPMPTRGRGRSAWSTLRTLGPWLAVHLVLFATAVATAWYTYAHATVLGQVPIPAVAFGVVLVALVVFLSVLHLVSLAAT